MKAYPGKARRYGWPPMAPSVQYLPPPPGPPDCQYPTHCPPPPGPPDWAPHFTRGPQSLTLPKQRPPPNILDFFCSSPPPPSSSSRPRKKSRLSEKVLRWPSPTVPLSEVHQPHRSSSCPRPVLSRRQILASLEETDLFLLSSSSSTSSSEEVFSRSCLLRSLETNTQLRRSVLGSAGEEVEGDSDTGEVEEDSDSGEEGHTVAWQQEEEEEEEEEEWQEEEEGGIVPHSSQSQDYLQSVRLEDLTWVATLGVGGFGRVELVTGGKNNDRPFALKKMKKIEIQDVKQQQHILNEKKIMSGCQSPFIVQLYRTYNCPKYLYMLMEPCLGGELWTLLRNSKRFSDDTASFYVACVILALEYLHSQGVIYRDLKPENLLLDSSGYIKLTDFGFAKQLCGEERAWTFCGTPEYVAPEIITNKSHDQRADIWSVGILVFELVTGAPPFTNNKASPGTVYQHILRGMKALSFPTCISGPASEVIRSCCRLLASQRPSLAVLKRFIWFSGLNWSLLEERRLPPPSVPVISHSISVENFDSYLGEVTDPLDCHTHWSDSF